MPEMITQINLPAILVANGLGASLMLVLIFSGRRRVRTVPWDGRIFHWMCRICLFLCVVETASFLIDGRQFWGARELNILLNTLLFLMNMVFAFLWVCYADFKLFEDAGRLRRRSPVRAIPAAVLCLLCVVNLFTEVFFGVTQDNVYYRAPLCVLPYVVTYGYLACGAILVFVNRKRVDKYLFMPVVIFLLPVCLGSLIQLHCYGIALVWVSAALGLTSLYVSLQNEESYLDGLTNLYNRGYLLNYMDYLAKRAEKGRQASGIMLDVNDFKYINDTYGHMEGDAVLRGVGKVLVRAVAGKGVVARYGGDEFVILLPDAAEETSRCVQKDILARLAEFNAAGTVPCPISLSMGAARFSTADVDEFFRSMDRDMYEKKRAFYQCTENDRRRRGGGPERRNRMS